MTADPAATGATPAGYDAAMKAGSLVLDGKINDIAVAISVGVAAD